MGNYPLVSDFNKQISRDYGVLIEEAGIALRGLFIVDPSGVLRQMSINDLPVGRSVDETLRLIKAFQFVEKNGEVSPANWTPDSPTIKPDPKGSLEYFDKVNCGCRWNLLVRILLVLLEGLLQGVLMTHRVLQQMQ